MRDLEKHRELFMIENWFKYLRLIDIGTGASLVVFHKSFSSLSTEWLTRYHPPQPRCPSLRKTKIFHRRQKQRRSNEKTEVTKEKAAPSRGLAKIFDKMVWPSFGNNKAFSRENNILLHVCWCRCTSPTGSPFFVYSCSRLAHRHILSHMYEETPSYIFKKCQLWIHFWWLFHV